MNQVLARMVCVVTLGVTAFVAQAADLTLKKGAAKAPAEIAPEIAAVLQDESIQLLNGDKPVYEFWFVKKAEAVSKAASADKSLDSLKDTALLGVVKVHEDVRDFRDDEVTAGVYTMRFGLQPKDGDHLGTAPFPYFAILIPADLDKTPGSITDPKALHTASREKSPADHPANLSLRPVTGAEGEFPRLDAPDAEHKTVIVKVPAAAGADTFELVFAVTYEGVGKV